MRSFIVTRGAPGCGKSTFIEKAGLKPYTLCADDIRLLFRCPDMGFEKGTLCISQQNDKDVWALLFELAEKRMQRGELVVIDATHSKSSDLSRYNKLCARYRYRRYYVDFSDVPADICKKQNQARSPEKRVPEIVIDRMYSRLRTQKQPSGWTALPKDPQAFWQALEARRFDLSGYRRIFVIGGIGGCLQPLEELFSQHPFSQEEFYIFTGGYTGPGARNKEVLERLMPMAERPNVLFLEGAGDRNIYLYGGEECAKAPSRRFRKHVAPQLEGVSKKDLRSFYRRMGQMAWFIHAGREYLITHGGLPYMPASLVRTASDQMINGVGAPGPVIDAVWTVNEPEIIQIHGGRRLVESAPSGTSYNLGGSIEKSRNMHVAVLSQTGPSILSYACGKEDIPAASSCRAEMPEDGQEMVEKFRNSPDIKEKDQGAGISSFNFSRRAFRKGRWNELTSRARGLFVDTETGKVVARGYEKFFNIDEKHIPDAQLSHLLARFKGQRITAYKKENGYLGLLSLVDGQLFFATKSTCRSDHVDRFREIFQSSPADADAVRAWLAANDHTLVFEVVDPVCDPHIIKYEKPCLILLDAVRNGYSFSRLPYEDLCTLADRLGLEAKKVYRTFADEKEFLGWYTEHTDEYDLSDTDIEGVVIECGDAMAKVKFPYYRFWKQMRSVADQVRRKRPVKLASLWHPKANYFYAWLKEQDDQTLALDVISLRERFEKQRCACSQG